MRSVLCSCVIVRYPCNATVTTGKAFYSCRCISQSCLFFRPEHTVAHIPAHTLSSRRCKPLRAATVASHVMYQNCTSGAIENQHGMSASQLHLPCGLREIQRGPFT